MLTKIEITREMVGAFAELSGDFNKIHVDEEFAKTTFFKRCIAHGTLVSGLIGTKIAKDFESPILKSLNLSFTSPVYVESEISIKFSEITKDKNNVKFNILVISDDGKECVSGHSEISVKK